MSQAPANLRIARVIALSLALGVWVLWSVAWVMTEAGSEPLSLGVLDPQLAFWIWAAVAVTGFAGALFFRGQALSRLEKARQTPGGPQLGQAAAVQSGLLVAWALLEGPALLAGVIFLLIGAKLVLATAVPVYLIGVVATFPRAEWFGEGGVA